MHSSDESDKKITKGKQTPKAKQKQPQKQPQKKGAKTSVDILADKIKETSVNIRPVEKKGKDLIFSVWEFM